LLLAVHKNYACAGFGVTKTSTVNLSLLEFVTP
jgi:hypothetical protein